MALGWDANSALAVIRTWARHVEADETIPNLFNSLAPRLTKCVRYRVVEESDDGYTPPAGIEPVRLGMVLVSTGEEALWTNEPWHSQGGWYALREGTGLHRVVRVEPEKRDDNLNENLDWFTDK